MGIVNKVPEMLNITVYTDELQKVDEEISGVPELVNVAFNAEKNNLTACTCHPGNW